MLVEAFNPKNYIKKKSYKDYCIVDDNIEILFSKEEDKYKFETDKKLFINSNICENVKEYIDINFKDTYTTQPIYMLKLKNAFIYKRTTLTPRHLLLVSGNKYITSFLSSKSLNYYQNNGLLDVVDPNFIRMKKDVKSDLIINQNCLFLYSFSNLYHVVMEVIPNLIFENKMDFSDFVFLLYGTEKKILESILDILGYKNKIIILDNLNIQVKNLFIPSFQTFGHITAPRKESIKFPHIISGKLQDNYLNDYIYISRNDAHQRITINEEAVIKILKKYNFKIIIPGQFTIKEQIKIFANAKYIVAPHGMGITNILFRRGNFTLVEIFPDGWTRNCYFRIVQLLKGQYRGVFLPSFNDKNDLEIDLNILEGILKEDLFNEN